MPKRKPVKVQGWFPLLVVSSLSFVTLGVAAGLGAGVFWVVFQLIT